MSRAFSFENDFLAFKAEEINMTGIPFNGHFIDIGIPEDYEKARYCLPEWAKDA
jgi:NDP-sugar pyrophosphorylase family protein